MSKKTTMLALVLLLGGAVLGGLYLLRPFGTSTSASPTPAIRYQPRMPLDNSGFTYASTRLEPWKDPTSLEDIAQSFMRLGYRHIGRLDEQLTAGSRLQSGMLEFRLQAVTSSAA